MQKAIRHILAVLGRMLVIGSLFQILLGVLWIGANFGRFQEFGDSLFYIEVSKSLVCDEYTGILYPVLLMLVRGMERLLPIPYTFVMHILQLVVSGYAGVCLLRAFGVEKRITLIWGSLVLLTLPMAVQCHLAILPNSLALAAFMLELSYGIALAQQEKPGQYGLLCKMNLFWLLGALLLPEYGYLGAIPVIILWVHHFCKYRKAAGRRVVYHLLLVVAFAGMLTGIQHLTQQEGAYGRAAGTWESALFRRVTWTVLEESYEQWPSDIYAVCSADVMDETILYADEMERVLQPYLEETVGIERARQFYRETIPQVFAANRVKLLREIAWDIACYTLPPLVLDMVLEGRGYDSYAGRNYEIMKAESPVLTKHYINYGAWWFGVGICLAFVMKMLMAVQRRKCNWMSFVLCVIPAGGFALWYTLQGAGVGDYKNGLFAGVMWLLWMVMLVNGSVGEECHNE